VQVLLPFVAGFFLTNLFRAINALISGELTSDLALAAGDLGLLTSVYFLTMAAAQVPIGICLDRYGPRRVESALLLVAAGGAALFGMSQGFAAVVFGRALIGLGVAAGLMAGIKAVTLWFPKERVALTSGWLITLGALGAVTATVPAELLLAWTGWRGLFGVLALTTAATAVIIYIVVPEASWNAVSPAPVSWKKVYSDSRFWRLAPLSATCIGTAWGLQGLWVVPWLIDVEGVDRAGVVRHLFVMALAPSIGALLLGLAADWLNRRSIGPQAQLTFVVTVFVAAQLTLIFGLPVPSYLLWSIVAAAVSATVLSYAILAEYIPQELTGRVNGLLNLFHFGAAFAIQYAIGLIVQHWTSVNGHYPVIAYRVAFGLNLTLQLAALIWFELPRIRKLLSALASTCIRKRVRHQLVPIPASPYQQALRAWLGWCDAAHVEATSWRRTAFGSASLSALLAGTLAWMAAQQSVTSYVIDVDRVHTANNLHWQTASPSPYNEGRGFG